MSPEACDLVRYREPLAMRTSLRCGGWAELYAEPTDLQSLGSVIRLASERGLPVRVLGGGTNLLVSDTGVMAVVVRLRGELAGIAVEGSKMAVGAGASLGSVVVASIRAGLSGIEPLAGIPGTLGGALAGNAGVPSRCIGDVVASVQVLTDDGAMRSMAPSECEFAYRRSGLGGFVILGAELVLSETSSGKVLEAARQTVSKRARLPRGNTAGSVFKNPPGDFAGRLLELAGMKGVSHGGARYSDAHANFIVNEGGTASDVAMLVRLGFERVKSQTGVELEPEIKLWN